MKIKSKDIITKRNILNKDITKYWSIIRQENIISKAAAKAKLGSGFDLKALYNLILQYGDQRIKIKLYLQAINMGYTNFNEFKADTNYETIYTLNEKKEQLVQLGMVKVINPQFKAQKGKSIKIIETFTKQKIDMLKNTLQLEINALEKKIEDFNENTTLEIPDEDVKLPY